MKKSVKYGLYFVVGLVAGGFVVCGVFFFLLLLASIVYFLLLFPAFDGKWKVYIVMPWMYLCIYGYYRLTKRYTDWWCEWEKNN